MVIYGVHPVAEVLERAAAGSAEVPPAVTLLVARSGAGVRGVRRRAAALGIAVRTVTAAELARRCGSDAHRGVALVGSSGGSVRTAPPVAPCRVRRRAGRGAGERRGPAGPAVWRRRFAEAAQPAAALVVVADGVTDPANLGSITRSAEQFGASLLVVPRRRAARFDDTVMRLSAGAAAHVATVAVANVATALAELKRLGFWIYGADTGGEALDEVRFPERVVLVLGSEGAGLHELVRRRCDHLVRIATSGRLDSLNVGVAAGILMHELRRQQRRRESVPGSRR